MFAGLTNLWVILEIIGAVSLSGISFFLYSLVMKSKINWWVATLVTVLPVIILIGIVSPVLHFALKVKHWWFFPIALGGK